MHKVGFTLALFGIIAGSPAIADQFIAGTPALRIATEPDGYKATTPTLILKTNRDSYRATTPSLTALAGQDAFRATTPALTAVLKRDGFRASTPALRAVVKSDGFRAKAPTLSVVTLQDSGNGAQSPREQRTSQPITGAVTRCDGLLQCFSKEDILNVETSLKNLGYTPETYPTFCRDIARSLGGCTIMPSAPGGSTPFGEPMPQGIPDDEISGFALNRCLPLERYAIDLQKRSDAGEDTDAEEERLTVIIISASKHLMNGRADRYCAEITANLP